jgi:putative FmdB family regulatory protein
MPTYEYKCEKGHEFEVFQRMNEPPVEKCIHCGAKAERQLSAGAGLHFKGSGFYTTDYRSDTYKKAAEADSGSKKPEKSEKSEKSESPKTSADAPKAAAPKSDSSSTSSGTSGTD